MTDPEDEGERTVADLADRDPGVDEEDPYADRSIADLPAWWRNAIREYDKYDMRTFQPSRFEDGVVVASHLDRLETEHDVDVSLFGDVVNFGDPWKLSVDGQPVAEVGHRRSPEGYSVFEMTSDRIAELVESHAHQSE